jgi:hypothetical protein
VSPATGLALLSTTRPFGQPPPPSAGSYVPEFVIAGILVALGLRSLRRWMRTEFRAESPAEQVLYSAHVFSRVGMWFAVAGLFVGYALVEDPQSLGWYVFVLLGLAGLRLMSSFYLWRSSPRPEGPEGKSEGVSGPLLANGAREALRGEGFADVRIELLAGEFIAEHPGEGLPEFLEWARRRGPGTAR